MSFVVVTHLPVGHVSALRDILGRYTQMPVSEIKDGDSLLENNVHVLTEDSVMSVRGGCLRLRKPKENRRDRDPINLFFSSLAEELGERSVGVILSGGGSDGTLGAKAIKEHGGLTLAQGVNSTAPRHSGMPNSAIEASKAPAKKNGRRRPQRTCQVLSDK